MLSNQPVPEASGRIWATCYMDADTEIFEIRTENAKITDEIQRLYHKEYSIGISLTNFLYADLEIFSSHLVTLKKCLDDIKKAPDSQQAASELFRIAMYWMRQSGLFAPFAAAIQRQPLLHSQEKNFDIDEIIRHWDYYKQMQPILRHLAKYFFKSDKLENMSERYFMQRKEYAACYPLLRYGEITYGFDTKGQNGYFPYDNLLNACAPATREDEICMLNLTFATEILNTSEPEDLINFVLAGYMRQNVRFRTCKFCGRYFGITGNPKTEFCDRIVDGSTKTCKEIGAFRLYEKRKMKNPAIQEYKRSYKAHNARIRYGTMTHDEFTAWSLEARRRRDLCVAGKLSLEEFVEWLDHDRQK